MVRGRAAMLDGGRRAGRQHLHELLQRDPLVEDAAEGEIEAGPVGIDVGEAAGDRAVAAPDVPDRVAGNPCELLMEVAAPPPSPRPLARPAEASARRRPL